MGEAPVQDGARNGGDEIERGRRRHGVAPAAAFFFAFFFAFFLWFLVMPVLTDMALASLCCCGWELVMRGAGGAARALGAGVRAAKSGSSQVRSFNGSHSITFSGLKSVWMISSCLRNCHGLQAASRSKISGMDGWMDNNGVGRQLPRMQNH